MAWALLELAHRTGREDLRRAGRAAFAYEDSLFDSERGNWPDLRADGKTGDAPRFPVAWCHGAPGIALARLRAVAADPDHAGEPAWRDGARAALGQLVERRGPWPSGTPSGGPNPSLMLGTSGLGTCLLRAL
jgi:lantibiotic modifying enzyme